MTAFSWGKHFIGMISDDKFLAAADIAEVNPLLPPVVFSALFERAIENHDAGSFAGFQPRALAAKFRVAVEEVERVIAAFAELAIVAGGRLVNWVKRQACSETVKRVSGVSSVSTPRVKRFRARQRDPRQGEFLLPIQGGSQGETGETPERERDKKEVPPNPHTVGACRKRGSRKEGTSPRQLAEVAEAAAEREAEAVAAAHQTEAIERWARLREGGADDDQFPRQHLARIKRRQAELFGRNEAA